ncbi:MAG: TRAP transporter substrate-binding protein DctP [Betaproteobacteria bacterium]|nr:TRAP transporter substrate-binding protein DctP [Betaproteobacteria bacterium]
MKKHICGVLAAAIAAFAFATEVAAQAPIEIKIADSFPKGHVIYDTVVSTLIPALEEGGKIKVKYFPANQLGQMADVIESIHGGVADIAYVAPGIVAGRMPVTNLMSLPGQFTSGEHLARVFMKMADGPLKVEYDKLGIKIITASGTPPYQVFTRTKVVKVPADAKGLKLRGGGGDADDFMRDAGINVINMPASQMYEALQKGVLDGVAYLQATAPANHLQEVTKQATEGAPLMSLLALYFVSQKKWDAWPPDIQAIVKRAGEKMSIEMGKEYDRRDQDGKKVFLAAGGTVNVLTEADKQAWRDAYKDAPEKMIKKMEGRGFGYARQAYTEMQKLRATP